MGKAKGKQRQDKFYHLAKEHGYRSRAAFKLVQLDARFRFLATARAVLDLCAAPGGWVQVAVKHAPVGAFVVGVDLAPIRPIRGAFALTEDITTTKCRAAVRRIMGEHGVAAFDVVLHDGSPNVGGAWAQEATAQSALVVDAARLATQFLAPKGTFVTKVFRSQDYNAILYCLGQLFEKVEATKPVASRSTSAEIYVVCMRYKAPAKIAPELLDFRHLFQTALEKPKARDPTRETKQKRNREGYEEGNTTLWKVGLASDFIWSEKPHEFLGSVNAISFEDPACLLIKNHELTTDEIKSLCEDLYVLDKHSFKHLLRWQLRIKRALLSSSSEATPKATDVVSDARSNDDEQLLKEMEELTGIIERKKKREKKRLAKRHAKDKARKATGMQIDATADGYFDPELFSINSIKGMKELQTVESTELNVSGDSESEDTCAVALGDSAEEMDSDEEQTRYDTQLEEMLDEAYERFVTRRGGKTKQDRKRARRVDIDADADLLEGGEDDDNDVQMDQDSDEDQDQGTNPLVLSLEEKKLTQEQIMEQWFRQDIFTEAGAGEAKNSDDSEEDKGEKSRRISIRQEENATAQRKELKTGKAGCLQGDDFEIVPEEPIRTGDDSSSSSDESEESDLDVDTKAEILAYAKKMLRKKQREQILDDAYNRYTFDDEGLPKWFLEEEKKHRQPMKPVTKEEIAAMKAQFKEIDARPAKKVAEAKARKKRAAMRKMDKARKKADAIADQNDISERSKRKMIDQLYRKAMPKKPQKEYVVAKKGVKVKVGKGKVLVDRRMKKDKRVHGAGKQGKGGLKKGKGAKGKAKDQKGRKTGKAGRNGGRVHKGSMQE